MSFQIVQFTADWKQQVIDLLNLCLPSRPFLRRDGSYWDWKHDHNPFGPSLILLGLMDGKLAGMRAFMQWKLVQNGQSITAVKPVDSVTHPHYQRQGVFTRLTQAAYQQAASEDAQVVFNTPNSQSYKGYLKLGWEHVGRLPVLLRCNAPLRCGLRTLLRLTGSKKNPPDEDAFFHNRPTPASELLAKDAVVQELVDHQHCPTDSTFTARSAQFLRWRYGEHPHVQYWVEEIWENYLLAGFLVYRLNLRRGLKEVMIDDCIVRDGYMDAADALVAQLVARVNCDIIVAHEPASSQVFDGYRSAGFSRMRFKQIQLVARSIGGFSIPKIDNWSLCLGDCEGL